MIVWQSFLIALEMLRLHKLRSFLTMLGVIIGVMSVTTIVLISSAFQNYMTFQFKKLGADTIIIVYDPGGMFRGPMGGITGIKNADVDWLLERVPALDIAAPILMCPAKKVVYGDREITKLRVFGTNQYSAQLNRLGIVDGRNLSKADVDGRANVCVVGEEIRDKFFRDKRAIGKFITFDGITLEIVGVMETIDMMGENTGSDVWLPITTAQDKWVGGENVTMITTRPKAGYNVNETVERVWRALMVKSGNRPVFRVDSREAIINIFGQVLGVAGIVLAAVAALSLLVGGIGIMNIMLVSVTERTREIGLRKAVGAKSSSVLVQFLVEAATLSLVGGIIGMGIAYGFGSLVTVITVVKQWPGKDGLSTPFPMQAAIGSLVFSALIGVVFGLFPAARAARLSPIEALRTE
ncbi:MAG: ABC transporter permease [Armatimonadetes bacterium]|nr:ABC transporter permease [Armatimonadota bacterium]